MVLRHKFNVVGHKFNVVGHESLARCFTNENEGNLQKNECSSSRSSENLKVVGENEGSGAMSGTATYFSNFSKIRLEGRRGDPID